MADRPAPDIRLGLFETLLVLDGAPVALDAHLARLGASLATALRATLPDSAAELARDAARGIELGRLRLTAAPAGDHWKGSQPDFGEASIGLCAEAAPIDPRICLPSWEHGVDLRSFELPGGLGEHKWRDRSALPNEETALTLLLDHGGEVLEGSRANVFAVRNGALFTPPLDGRVLPGTGRATVLAIAATEGIEVTERPLHREELLDADEVFLTGSVRGIEPVRTLDGAALGHGPLMPQLAGRLAERWGVPAPLPSQAGR
jgi:branched-subunit amino acid aminotransferase/4-amino-4-deoxychorismate lyase